MKTYTIKKEFLDDFGNLTPEDYVMTEKEAAWLAKEWEVDLEDVLRRLDFCGETGEENS